MKFQTIRQTAASGILPENRIRQRLKEGRLPGIYSGTRFLVNIDALEDMLAAETAQSIRNAPKEQLKPWL